jgi:hypothetical protein
MPLPRLLYAQVVKTVRRQRLVGVKHRVVFGTLEAVAQVLATCGWQINTSFVERLNAAGLTDCVWSLRDVLLYRVSPWPQPQAL